MTSRSFRPSARETALRLMNTLAAERACERLIVAYAHTLDFGHADQAAALFTEDGILEAEGQRFMGRPSIEQVLELLVQRHAPTRHAVSSIGVRPHDDGTADGLAYLTLYGGANTGPLLIGHIRDRFQADGEGGWRITFRRIDAIARDDVLAWPT